jgi:O-antigen/teichoic acid export membrane protein
LSLGRSAFLLVAVEGVLGLLGVVVTPYLVSRLGLAQYGILAMVSVLGSYLSVLQLGVEAAATRSIAEARGTARGDVVASRRAATLLLASASALAVGGVYWTAAPYAWTILLRPEPGVRELALVSVGAAAFVVALAPLMAGISGCLQGLERFGRLAVSRLAYGLALPLAAVAAVASGRDVVGVLQFQALIGSLVVGTISLVLARHSSLRNIGGALASVLSIGIPFAIAGLLAPFLADGEKLVLAALRQVEDVTLYVVPHNAARRLAIVGVSLAGVLMPRIAALASSGQSADAALLLRKAERLLVAVTSLIVLPTLLMTPELLDLWLGEDFATRATLPTRIVLAGLLVNIAARPANAAVRARSHPKTLMFVYAIEVPVFLLAAVMATHWWGLPGAATAWSARAAADAFVQRGLAERALGVRLGEGRTLWGMGALSVAAIVLCELLVTHVGWQSRLAMSLMAATGLLLWLLSGGRRRLVIDLALSLVRPGVPRA